MSTYIQFSELNIKSKNINACRDQAKVLVMVAHTHTFTYIHTHTHKVSCLTLSPLSPLVQSFHLHSLYSHSPPLFTLTHFHLQSLYFIHCLCFPPAHSVWCALVGHLGFPPLWQDIEVCSDPTVSTKHVCSADMHTKCATYTHMVLKWPRLYYFRHK